MTGGKAILLLNDFALETIEFNGDMYPEGYGNELLRNLTEIDDDVDFVTCVEDFNGQHFGYQEHLVYQVNNEDLYCNDIILIEDLRRVLNTDWMYVKNGTDKPIDINIFGEIIKLEPGVAKAFDY